MGSQRQRRTSSMHRSSRAIPSPQEGSGNEVRGLTDSAVSDRVSGVSAYMTSGAENGSTEHVMDTSDMASYTIPK
eukprot:1153629-Pelagomonas_calceolata.AAC.3